MAVTFLIPCLCDSYYTQVNIPSSIHKKKLKIKFQAFCNIQQLNTTSPSQMFHSLGILLVFFTYF